MWLTQHCKNRQIRESLGQDPVVTRSNTMIKNGKRSRENSSDRSVHVMTWPCNYRVGKRSHCLLFHFALGEKLSTRRASMKYGSDQPNMVPSKLCYKPNSKTRALRLSSAMSRSLGVSSRGSQNYLVRLSDGLSKQLSDNMWKTRGKLAQETGTSVRFATCSAVFAAIFLARPFFATVSNNQTSKRREGMLF